MSRYRGPKWKLSRRLGISLSETGKEIQKRPYAPGQHGAKNVRAKKSEFAVQLMEKQKLRRMYGVSEKQFRRIFSKSARIPGIHGENFMFLLERRLDNVVYRLGLARTREGARQLVNHGHVLVDGKKVDIPSYTLSVGQSIALRERSKNLSLVKDALANKISNVTFVEFDENKMQGSLKENPKREELSQNINESLIVEFYNRN